MTKSYIFLESEVEKWCCKKSQLRLLEFFWVAVKNRQTVQTVTAAREDNRNVRKSLDKRLQAFSGSLNSENVSTIKAIRVLSGYTSTTTTIKRKITA